VWIRESDVVGAVAAVATVAGPVAELLQDADVLGAVLGAVVGAVVGAVAAVATVARSCCGCCGAVAAVATEGGEGGRGEQALALPGESRRRETDTACDGESTVCGKRMRQAYAASVCGERIKCIR
jgi:hypothetical protein